MEQDSGRAVPLQPVHYGLAAGASDDRKSLNLASWSPRDHCLTFWSSGGLYSLSPAHHSNAKVARPTETNMPLLLSPQVLRGLRGAVSVAMATEAGH